jgi:hypothetical protein
MTQSRQPVVITAVSSKAHLLRQVAADLNLPYEEASSPDQGEITRFVFSPLNEEQTRWLVDRVPREVYAYKAVFR